MMRRVCFSCKTSPIRSSDSQYSSLFTLPGVRSVPVSRRPRVPRTIISRTHSSGAISHHDRLQVEQLTDWSSHPTSILNKTSEVTFTAQQSQSEVDRLILARRSKNTLPKAPNTTESQVKHIEDLSYRRLLKKQTENFCREKSQLAKRYEEEMEKTAKELEMRLKEERKKAMELREEASKQRNIILQCKDSLKATKRALILTDSQEKPKNRSFRAEDVSKLIYKKSQQQAILFSKEEECRSQVELSKQAIVQLRDTAQLLDTQVSLLEKELETVRKTQFEHLTSMLKEGTDTRAQGLPWIIRRLWKAGQTVSADMFPAFLDDEAVHCVLFLAQKSLEAEELTAYLQVNKPSVSPDPPHFRDHWNNIHSRLKESVRVLKVQQPQIDPIRMSRSQTSPTLQPNQYQITGKNTDSDLVMIETRLGELKELIQKVQEGEIRRLTSECFLNNYEKRYKVNMKTVLSAIVGVDVIDRYLASVNKEQKTLAEQMAKTKTFYFQGA